MGDYLTVKNVFIGFTSLVSLFGIGRSIHNYRKPKTLSLSDWCLSKDGIPFTVAGALGITGLGAWLGYTGCGCGADSSVEEIESSFFGPSKPKKKRRKNGKSKQSQESSPSILWIIFKIVILLLI